MIGRALFNRIKERHGQYASWAAWAESGDRPKDNVGDLSMFDTPNDQLLNQLNPNAVLVGLNISRGIQFPLGNFHDPRPRSTDFKIRYALKDTALWGAYMTDIIKDFEQKASGKMMAYLRAHPDFERTNVDRFLTELSDLGVNRPTLVAFGRDAFDILKRNLWCDHTIWKLPHYANYMSKEVYRDKVAEAIETQNH